MVERNSASLASLLLIVAAAFVLLVCSAKVTHGQSNQPLPRTRLSLRSYAFEPPKPEHGSNEELSRTLPLSEDYDIHWAFLDPSTLAVYFVERGEPALMRRQNPQPTDPLHLKVLFIDASSGALRGRQDWPTRSRRGLNDSSDTQSRILPVHDGRFLVHAGDRLKLYTPDLTLVQERELSLKSAAGLEAWAVHIAPGGRIALLEHIEDDKSTLEWMNVDTFQTLYSARDYRGLFSASEQAVVGRWSDALRIHPAAGRARILCSSGFCGKTSHPLFLSNDEFLVTSLLGVALVSTAGETLWSREYRAEANCGLRAERSLDASRFALIASCRQKRRFDGAQLPRGDAILVYDRQTLCQVFSLHLNEGEVDDVELAPDGLTLGVRSATEINVYDLPARLNTQE